MCITEPLKVNSAFHLITGVFLCAALSMEKMCVCVVASYSCAKGSLLLETRRGAFMNCKSSCSETMSRIAVQEHGGGGGLAPSLFTLLRWCMCCLSLFTVEQTEPRGCCHVCGFRCSWFIICPLEGCKALLLLSCYHEFLSKLEVRVFCHCIHWYKWIIALIRL